MKSYNGFTPKERTDAFIWLKGEYASGRREKGKVCDACGQTKGIVEDHSEDYSYPYGDHIGKYTFCYRCHMMIHCRFRNRLAWSKYKDDIREGKRFEPFYTRNFRTFAVESLNNRGMEINYEKYEKQPETVLDEIG